MTDYELTVRRIEWVKYHLQRMRTDNLKYSTCMGLLVRCKECTRTTKEGDVTLSNERAGKWKSATLRDGGGMQQVNFFKYAKEVT